ncbi:MAG: hypothetical protein HY885_01690 [Deltaproteobacteria bacterium]|nr:hypothetical protein [Deltaproteobacteria bacterium]
MRHIFFIFAFIASLTLAGCMSAQHLREQRIAENQELFADFSPVIQEQISLGQIDIGFNEEMVNLSWGSPDQTFIRTTDKGEATVWTYTNRRLLRQTDRMSLPVRVHDDRGRSSIVYRNVWVDRNTEEIYPVARVEFVQGIVIAIERLTP